MVRPLARPAAAEPGGIPGDAQPLHPVAGRDAPRFRVAAGRSGPFRILTVPCGLPRDVRDFATRIAAEAPEHLAKIEYHGIDLDPMVVDAATTFLAGSPIRKPRIVQGNALDPACYGDRPYHCVASTGLGEFLEDDDLGVLYGNVFTALAPGGVFFTSATAFDGKSDALLRTFELRSQYRTRKALERLLAPHAWTSVRFETHPTGLQTFVRAIK
jgi:hypothetical protein